MLNKSEDAALIEFIGRDLKGARFVASDLSGAVMRAVDIAGADIDAPWLLDGESTLLVNGVDVAPYVEAELNRRFPGRPSAAPTPRRRSGARGRRSRTPGPVPSSAPRGCPTGPATSAWAGSGPSPRRCATW